MYNVQLLGIKSNHRYLLKNLSLDPSAILKIESIPTAFLFDTQHPQPPTPYVTFQCIISPTYGLYTTHSHPSSAVLFSQDNAATPTTLPHQEGSDL